MNVELDNTMPKQTFTIVASIQRWQILFEALVVTFVMVMFSGCFAHRDYVVITAELSETAKNCKDRLLETSRSVTSMDPTYWSAENPGISFLQIESFRSDFVYYKLPLDASSKSRAIYDSFGDRRQFDFDSTISTPLTRIRQLELQAANTNGLIMDHQCFYISIVNEERERVLIFDTLSLDAQSKEFRDVVEKLTKLSWKLKKSARARK